MLPFRWGEETEPFKIYHSDLSSFGPLFQAEALIWTGYEWAESEKALWSAGGKGGGVHSWLPRDARPRDVQRRRWPEVSLKSCSAALQLAEREGQKEEGGGGSSGCDGSAHRRHGDERSLPSKKTTRKRCGAPQGGAERRGTSIVCGTG